MHKLANWLRLFKSPCPTSEEVHELHVRSGGMKVVDMSRYHVTHVWIVLELHPEVILFLKDVHL